MKNCHSDMVIIDEKTIKKVPHKGKVEYIKYEYKMNEKLK
jgi:hypothetical protein